MTAHRDPLDDVLDPFAAIRAQAYRDAADEIRRRADQIHPAEEQQP